MKIHRIQILSLSLINRLFYLLLTSIILKPVYNVHFMSHIFDTECDNFHDYFSNISINETMHKMYLQDKSSLGNSYMFKKVRNDV